jgi:hypothetical protein
MQNSLYSETNITDSKKNHQLLQNPNVHYHYHNSPSLVHILSRSIQLTPPPYFLTIHSKIILTSVSTSSKLSLSLLLCLYTVTYFLLKISFG